MNDRLGKPGLGLPYIFFGDFELGFRGGDPGIGRLLLGSASSRFCWVISPNSFSFEARSYSRSTRFVATSACRRLAFATSTAALAFCRNTSISRVSSLASGSPFLTFTHSVTDTSVTIPVYSDFTSAPNLEGENPPRRSHR